MKKILFILTLTMVFTRSFSQCASDYVGDFGVSSCYSQDTNYSRQAYIEYRSPTKITIYHFAGIPYSFINCIDTICANLDCSFDSLTLETKTYGLNSGGSLTYSGHGRMDQGALMINFHQINPNFEQDFCYGYYNVTGIQDLDINKKTLHIWPNPADLILHLDTRLSCTYITVTDILGRVFNCNLNSDNDLDISQLNVGIYFLKAYMVDNTVLYTRFIKK